MAKRKRQKILGILEITPRLEKMENCLRKKTGRDICYLSLVGDNPELGLKGLYEYDEVQGNTIKLKVGDDEISEYTVAHELAHGLMRVDGFVSAAHFEETEELEEVTGRIRATILHTAMSAYLIRFGYGPKHRNHYQGRYIMLSWAKDQIAQLDGTPGWNCMLQTLEFVETFLVIPESVGELRPIFSKRAPSIWKNAHKWWERLRRYRLNSALSCRKATVVLIKQLDSYLAGEGVAESLLDHLVVPAVLVKSERKQPAMSVFRIDTGEIEGSYFGLLRYLRDESIVARVPLKVPADVSRLLKEAGEVSASDFLIRMEGKTPSNPFGVSLNGNIPTS